MTTLRIMTANLWTHHVDAAGFGEVIDRVDPDVLAVQELHPGVAATIVARFPHHALAPDPAVFGTGMAARHPIRAERLPLTYRRGWAIALDPGDWPGLQRPLHVFGVHFANPVGWPWWRSHNHRRAQFAQLSGHIGTRTDPVIVVGDFNAAPGWPLYRQLTGLLDDGVVAAGTTSPTWRLNGRGRARLRIDHVFVRGVTVMRSCAIAVPGADHLALVADIDVDR